jgi:hypothetical protein
MALWQRILGRLRLAPPASSLTPSAQLPESFLRGLRRSDWTKDGQVTTSAFEFSDRKSREQRAAAKHEPFGWEISIDWEDDGGVVALLLARDNAKFGVARVQREHLGWINRQPAGGVWIHAERRETNNNRHHGNLVALDSLSDIQRKILAGMVAAGARLIPVAAQDPTANT